MTMRQQLVKRCYPARIIVCIVVCAVSISVSPLYPAYAEKLAVPVTLWPRIETAAAPPATFFTINAVLAKLDRSRGRGRAIHLVSLKPSNTVPDPHPALTENPAVGPEPFGLFPFRAPEGLTSRKWRGMEADLLKDENVLKRCRAGTDGCPSYVAQLLRLINAIKSKSGRAQLDEANRGVNAAIRFVADLTQHGEVDRWSAPLATFATSKGDCEDFAIAKYVALRDAGFPINDLRVVLVRDLSLRKDHAVLAARLDDRWLILDSVRSEITQDSRITNLIPLFAIGRQGVLLLAASLE